MHNMNQTFIIAVFYNLQLYSIVSKSYKRELYKLVIQKTPQLAIIY